MRHWGLLALVVAKNCWLWLLPMLVGSCRRRESTSCHVMFVFLRVRASLAFVYYKGRWQDALTRVYATVVERIRWQTRVTMIYMQHSGLWALSCSSSADMFALKRRCGTRHTSCLEIEEAMRNGAPWGPSPVFGCETTAAGPSTIMHKRFWTPTLPVPSAPLRSTPVALPSH